MSKKKNVDKKNIRRLRNTLSCSNYSLRIFSKIYAGFRPSQIAKQLGISIQNVHYYTNNLIDLGLIEKLGDRSGVTWLVTERGLFILKQFLRGSVNSYNNQNNPTSLFYDANIPIRLHNVSFAFKINSSLEHLKIPWKNMKNGVSRHTVIKKNREDENTVDIVKTYNHTNSVMLVSIKTKDDKDRAEIDASHGVGELETNDPDYAYKYLIMPECIFDIYNAIRRIENKVSGYKRCYDPVITENN